MKGKDLFANIQEARQHINRLKKQAQLLEEAGSNNSVNIHEYVNEAIYSLNKNEQEIEKKHKQFSHKLPTINNKKEEANQSYSYKKQKRNLSKTNKKIKDESTKIDDSFSLIVQNRAMKVHSFSEKNNKLQFNSERIISSIAEIPLPVQQISKKGTPSSINIRRRQYEYKKSMKFIDLNKSSNLKDKSQSIVSGGKFDQYKQTVDKYSLHEFMIIKGKIVTDTPQFASYERIYESIFDKIMVNIHRIEDILIQYEVEFARLDGKKLAYLCLKDQIKKLELIDCLIDSKSLRQKMMPISKYNGKQGKIKAINKIKSYWKMKNIRQKYLALRKNTVAIQNFFRKKLLMLSLQRKIRKRNDDIIDRFEERQNKFVKQWKTIKDQKRIQIHLNSVEVDEQKRLTIQNYPERQNIQLSRIFRLKDPNLIIIYISSFQLPIELLNYYYTIMDLAGINNYRDRLIFISPDCASIFPSHYSVSKLLYYSARTLNQLKIITGELPTIIFPGNPCNQLIKICDYIGCYLFSGEPQKMKCFMTKSQTKRLLKNLCIQTPNSTMEMYDYGELLNTFSVLMIKNPQVETWIFKIDDEFGGRGLAYADFSTSKIVRSLLKKVQYQQSDTFATDVVAQPQNQQITIKIRDYLKDHLCERLKIATPTLYKSYTDFMGRFIKKGGVIEACPACPRQLLTYPSISFCLDPDGEYKIITTYEKIIGQPYRPIACSFPQRSLDNNQINSVCRQLSESFKLRKIFGVFTIDFVSFKKEKQSKWWVIGIDPFINNYTSSYYLFDMLMSGAYYPDKNMYLVAKQEKDDVSVDTSFSEMTGIQSRLAARDYIFVPHFFHKNLMKVKIKQFFKQARMEQFNFDIANKKGLCILLLDQLTSGVMGLMAVSDQKQLAIEQIKKVLDFISRISSVKNVEYGKGQFEPSSDAINLKDVLSVFTSFVRRSVRKNAKERAVKHFQMNQNLQLII